MAHDNSGPPVWWWLFLAFVLGTLAWRALRLLQRDRRFPAFAQRLGLAMHPDDTLPNDLPLQQASFRDARKVFHIAAGVMNNVPVITFDVRIGSGRSVSYFTVIGARAAGFPFGAERFDPDLTSERVGAWFLLYRPRNAFGTGRLMPFEQIEAQLRSVRVGDQGAT